MTYTGWCEGLDHLKIETTFINERFASVMGECETFGVTVREMKNRNNNDQVYYSRIKKVGTEDKKCHTKTMMSIIADEALK